MKAKSLARAVNHIDYLAELIVSKLAEEGLFTRWDACYGKKRAIEIVKENLRDFVDEESEEQ